MNKFKKQVLTILEVKKDSIRIVHKEGYKNKQGDPSPWCIIKNLNREDEQILSTHKSRKEAYQNYLKFKENMLQ